MYKLAVRKTLHSVNVLKDLAEPHYDKLFAGAPIRHIKAGQTLFSAGDDGDGCYRLEKGLLKITLHSPQGGERIFGIFGPSQIVGEISLIDGLPRTISAIALDDCTLCFISRQAFEQKLLTHPELCRELMTILASRLRKADQSMAALSFLTAKGRVARVLLELAEQVGHPDEVGHMVIKHRFSQIELASMADVTRESVNRVMSEWIRRNLVIKSTEYYKIIDLKTLELEIEYDH